MHTYDMHTAYMMHTYIELTNCTYVGHKTFLNKSILFKSRPNTLIAVLLHIFSVYSLLIDFRMGISVV